MSYKLVLAEKPSVAMSIAKVIGASKRNDGFMEGGGYLVSWCVGHLVELSEPEEYDERYRKWSLDALPIVLETWRYQVSSSTKKQFGIIKKLMERSDVPSLVCATDAGREGELIFRLVYHQCGCKKPFERLWISSMEDAAIREGFANLRPGTEYDALYGAALCRERADWLVGINGTRLFSCLYGPTMNVGRVMTPTLAMVVMRDAAIKGFVPEPFYTVQLKPEGFAVGSERMKEKQEAEKLAENCRAAASATVTKVEQKEKSEKPPLLYDLTSLQRDANRQLGFTAQQTLDYTQSLYEKKLVTYPRTDSRYLTDDMAGMLPELVKSMQAAFKIAPDVPITVNAAQVINSKKVSDHHAIIPTKTAVGYDVSQLPSGEQAVLMLIARRLICAVGTPCRYTETQVELTCADHVFTAKGKTILDAGWRAFEVKKAADTGKGGALVTVVSEQIQSPSMTADWEEKLLEVERGNYSGEAFMGEITGMVSDLVKNYEPVKNAEILIPAKGKVIGNCPACGSTVAEMQRSWSCTDRNCKFAIWKDNNYFKKLGKTMTPQLAEKLVKEGKAFLKGCHSAKTGRSYDATVMMTTDDNGRPVYELRFAKGGKKNA